MGMKHILRALDQALETAEVERKYLGDELEAERVEKQRLAAEMDELRKMAREPKAERDKLLETFREREMTWAGEREDMAGELAQSDFSPVAFELGFGGKDGQLPAVTITEGDQRLSVSGKVDRVDGWLHDGRLYLRVVDYKTGKKSFDLSDLRYGLGIQMLLYLFALRLAYARGMQTDAEIRRLTAELLRAGEVIKPRLADCEQIKYLASRFVNTQSCFFIGRGFDYSLSLEGSLKLKEISYVHSDAYAAGELKHGTISLVTDGVPVIALATQKQVYEKTISNAKETKSRGAKVLLFTTRDAVVPDGVADYVVRLDDYDDLLMPLQLIVPLQLFAYYMAVLRGCDVDKPRNLAKSVTVE